MGYVARNCIPDRLVQHKRHARVGDLPHQSRLKPTPQRAHALVGRYSKHALPYIYATPTAAQQRWLPLSVGWHGKSGLRQREGHDGPCSISSAHTCIRPVYFGGPLPTVVCSCSRTFAASTGKVNTSATAAPTPAARKRCDGVDPFGCAVTVTVVLLLLLDMLLPLPLQCLPPGLDTWALVCGTS